MNKFLITTALLLAFGAAPAKAVTSFHVTDSKATGSDPVLLNENTTFNIDDINNGATINSPLTIFFAVPIGETNPSVADFSFDGGALTNTGITINSLGVWTPVNGNGGDLYSFVGCTGCDGSINKSNVDAAEAALGLGSAPNFNVFSLTINQGFGGNLDFETVDGAFSLGTIIAPLAEDIVTGNNGRTTTTFFDTSWTNAGLENTPFSAPPVPEPSTWAMMALGFGLMGLVGYRKTRSALA